MKFNLEKKDIDSALLSLSAVADKKTNVACFKQYSY
jgi:hypothetical protein